MSCHAYLCRGLRSRCARDSLFRLPPSYTLSGTVSLSQNLISCTTASIHLATPDRISRAHVNGHPHPHDQTHRLFTPHEQDNGESRPSTLYHTKLSTVQKAIVIVLLPSIGRDTRSLSAPVSPITTSTTDRNSGGTAQETVSPSPHTLNSLQQAKPRPKLLQLRRAYR